MSLNVHLATLEQKHAALEAEIAAAKLKPAMSDAEVSDLKRRKLHLKDEMERLKGEHH